jgi:hypothetical protein
VDAWAEVLRGFLMGVVAARSIVELQVLEALNELVSMGVVC